MLRVYYEGRRPFELVKGPNTRRLLVTQEPRDFLAKGAQPGMAVP
jgi:hypothetical protein